ncbi:MAG: DUF4837 family protein [Chryseotalea sp.]|jgi:hypothetical protein|nr:DUF4837 family protein [Flammeovirgaceae bacterium]
MKKLIFALPFLLLALVTCTPSNDDSGKGKPKATGRSGDMIILMDSLQWRNELGEEVQKIFRREMDGLPRPEYNFNVKFVHPNKKIKLLTQIRNLVYVFTLDKRSAGTKAITDNLSDETLSRIENDTSFFIVNKSNEYSRDQEVLYLFGRNENELVQHLQKNRKQIEEFFNKAERKRIQEGMQPVTSTASLKKVLAERFQLKGLFPAGYKVADERPDFAWFRSPEAEIDKNFFIATKPYTSEYQLLPDSILQWRESITSSYIFEDPDQPSSYITVERDIPFNPIKSTQVNLNNKFAMELRGLWRTNTRTMGGPFLGYAFVNPQNNVLVYIEGFVFSPGKPQRELIREMEAIAYSIDPIQKPKSEKKN